MRYLNSSSPIFSSPRLLSRSSPIHMGCTLVKIPFEPSMVYRPQSRSCWAAEIKWAHLNPNQICGRPGRRRRRRRRRRRQRGKKKRKKTNNKKTHREREEKMREKIPLAPATARTWHVRRSGGRATCSRHRSKPIISHGGFVA